MSVAAASTMHVGTIVQRSAGLREIALASTLNAKYANSSQVSMITTPLSPPGNTPARLSSSCGEARVHEYRHGARDPKLSRQHAMRATPHEAAIRQARRIQRLKEAECREQAQRDDKCSHHHVRTLPALPGRKRSADRCVMRSAPTRSATPVPACETGSRSPAWRVDTGRPREIRSTSVRRRGSPPGRSACRRPQ